MASNFTVSGTNTTITFAWTKPTAQVQAVVSDCAEYLWNIYGDKGTEIEPLFFADLSNNQKLSIVENNLKKFILDTANTFKSNEAQEALLQAEELTKHEL